MATQIVIINEGYIKIDDSFYIHWTGKGNAMPSLPSTLHAVIWNELPGQNEIQNKDPATGNMTGNTDLNATSDDVGSTTVAALLTWGETRKSQIETAMSDDATAATEAKDAWVAAGNSIDDFVWDKTWIDYDPNYS
jgi:hypothetical protein